jgi:tetratricopeptide (TPR) repeat protein
MIEYGLQKIETITHLSKTDRVLWRMRLYEKKGIILHHKKQYKDAEQLFNRVKRYSERTSNYVMLASTLHQLGTLAKDLAKFEEALHYLSDSLDMKIKKGMLFEQAITCSEIAKVHIEKGERVIAKNFISRALSIYESFADIYSQTSIYHDLGVIAKAQGSIYEAEKWYEKILVIDTSNNNRYGQALTYGQLGLLSIDTKDWLQACSYLVNALNTFHELRDNYHVDITLRNLARLQRASGEAIDVVALAAALGCSEEEAAAALAEAVERETTEGNHESTEGRESHGRSTPSGRSMLRPQWKRRITKARK